MLTCYFSDSHIKNDGPQELVAHLFLTHLFEEIAIKHPKMSL